MKQLLKPFVTRSLGLVQAFPTAMTGPDDVRALLKRLRPILTDKDLIRLGPKGDGGYLIPNDLAGIKACFSPGVSLVSGFEKDCADLGMQVFMADKSVDRPAEEHRLFHFTKKYIGAISNDNFMTLDEWVDDSLPEKDSELLLQIDIEGNEYEVFLSTSETLMKRFRIIVAEFHQLDQFWNRMFFNLTSRALDKILQTHACVHLHPNNCKGSLGGFIQKGGMKIPRAMEFTFLRRDRVIRSSSQTKFPHPLDYDNETNPPLVLPSCWYDEA